MVVPGFKCFFEKRTRNKGYQVVNIEKNINFNISNEGDHPDAGYGRRHQNASDPFNNPTIWVSLPTIERAHRQGFHNGFTLWVVCKLERKQFFLCSQRTHTELTTKYTGFFDDYRTFRTGVDQMVEMGLLDYSGSGNSFKFAMNHERHVLYFLFKFDYLVNVKAFLFAGVVASKLKLQQYHIARSKKNKKGIYAGYSFEQLSELTGRSRATCVRLMQSVINMKLLKKFTRWKNTSQYIPGGHDFKGLLNDHFPQGSLFKQNPRTGGYFIRLRMPNEYVIHTDFEYDFKRDYRKKKQHTNFEHQGTNFEPPFNNNNRDLKKRITGPLKK